MTLQNFDTLLAFVAIMAGLSLLVTAINQMVSALLGLRGTNLKAGLQTLFDSLDPDLRAHADRLSRDVLCHPLISDSAFNNASRSFLGWDWWIEVKTQVMQLPPFRNWRLASAIRVDELIRILYRLVDDFWADAAIAAHLQALVKITAAIRLPADATPAQHAALAVAKASLQKLAALAAQKPRPWRQLAAEARTSRDALLASWPAIEEAIPAGAARRLDEPEAEQLKEFIATLASRLQLDVTLERVGGNLPSQQVESATVLARAAEKKVREISSEAAASLVPKLEQKTRDAIVSLEAWFNSAMDRTSQAFLLHIRMWTVLFSCLLVLGLELDSLDLLKRLSRDGELRTAVIGSAAALMQKAEEMNVASGSAVVGSSNIYVQVVREVLQPFAATNATVAAALHAFTNTTLPDITRATNWLGQTVQSVNLQLAAVQPPNTNALSYANLLQEFEDTLPQARLRIAADNLTWMLNNDLILQILPQPQPGEGGWGSRLRKHFPGIFASMVLLSLGAPFWFNMLKTLSNLRPILATKEEKEKQAAA